MTDHVDSKKRSEIMSLIRSRDTMPEVLVRSLIHGMGFRFRLHVDTLPGTPDIVLPRLRKIVFVNGCLWHGHARCSRAKLPNSNREFWLAKVKKNKKRDRQSISGLQQLGWNVMVVWACCLRSKIGQIAVETTLRRFLSD
jgi:DNA mismatch endonuclease (patch repair protein)